MNPKPPEKQGQPSIENIVDKIVDSRELARSRKSLKSSVDGCKRKRNCCGYKKRRLNCCGKRRYKTHVSGRACMRTYNNSRINLCNRNWARISIVPYINFLRVFRKKFDKCVPIEKINAKAKCQWKRMPKCKKKCYIEQAKRAKCRGFRT